MNPSYKLDVNGYLRYYTGGAWPGFIFMSGIYPGYYEFTDSGTLWGVSRWASSRRFKDKIVDLDIDSSEIYKLRPVSFNWKPDRGGKRSFGLIAEEVDGVERMLVNYGQDEKPFSVKYELLSVLLLNELKKFKPDISRIPSLVSRISELSVQVKEQRAQIEELKKEIKDIKKTMKQP